MMSIKIVQLYCNQEFYYLTDYGEHPYLIVGNIVLLLPLYLHHYCYN